jgi:hypothetical protein
MYRFRPNLTLFCVQFNVYSGIEGIFPTFNFTRERSESTEVHFSTELIISEVDFYIYWLLYNLLETDLNLWDIIVVIIGKQSEIARFLFDVQAET